MFTQTRRSVVASLMLTAGATACMSYRPTFTGSVAPQQNVRISFAAPVSIEATCAQPDPPGQPSGCEPDTMSFPPARKVLGTFQSVHGDSLLVLVKELEDSTGSATHVTPPRLAWISGRYAIVEERHTNVTGTVLLVVGLVGVVAAIAGASSGGNSGGNTPKNTGPTPPKDY